MTLDDALTYLFGPSADTAYRDAFRLLKEETAAEAHSRTAQTHYEEGRYREAVLSARLAAEMAAGEGGPDVKQWLASAPPDAVAAAETLYAKRHVAVHEGGTRIEQPDARQAIRAMKILLEYLSPNLGGD